MALSGMVEYLVIWPRLTGVMVPSLTACAERPLAPSQEPPDHLAFLSANNHCINSG